MSQETFNNWAKKKKTKSERKRKKRERRGHVRKGSGKKSNQMAQPRRKRKGKGKKRKERRWAREERKGGRGKEMGRESGPRGLLALFFSWSNFLFFNFISNQFIYLQHTYNINKNIYIKILI